MKHLKMLTPEQVQGLGMLVTLAGGKSQAITTFTAQTIYDGRLEQRGDAYQVRADSYTAGSTPYAQSRDELTQVLSTVLRKKRTPLQALELIKANDELQPGILFWKAYRVDATGEPTILGQGGITNDIPSVTVAQDSESFPVEYYAINARINFLESLAASLGTLINSRVEKLAAARESLERFQDKKVYVQVKNSTTHTLTDNPWIPRLFPGLIFERGDGVKAQAVYNEISEWLTIPADLNGVDKPDAPTTMLCTTSFESILKNLKFQDNSQYSVYKAILDDTSITEIITVEALRNVGPDGEDAVLMISPEDLEFMRVAPPTGMPKEIVGMGNENNYMWAADGGIKVNDPGRHVIAFVQVRGKYSSLDV